MNNLQMSAIKDELAVLQGHKLQSASRSGSMAAIGIGPMTEKKTAHPVVTGQGMEEIE